MSLSAFMVTTRQAQPDAGWGYFHNVEFGSAALFSALIIGLVATMIYVFLMKKNIIIKMPDVVPPAVSKAFAAIIPGAVAIYVFAIVAYLFSTYVGLAFNDWVSKQYKDHSLT